MAYAPYTPEIGAVYTLTNILGDAAVFNNPSDSNYVGMLTDVTGLDSASVRESGGDLVGGDGGWHGNFYYGRRAISLSGTVFGHSGAEARAARLDHLIRASDAMRSDAILSWQPMSSGVPAMQTWVRRQQPLRISGAWNKDFQLQVVSPYAQLFSTVLHNSSTGLTAFAENQGSSASKPAFVIHGPSSGPITVSEVHSSGTLKMLSSLVLGSGDVLTVDTATHTASVGGVSANSYIDFANTKWGSMAIIRATTFNYTVTNAASMYVVWRDTWI